jgi:hypothetical protein
MIEKKPLKLIDRLENRVVEANIDRNEDYGYDPAENKVKYFGIVMEIKILGVKFSIARQKEFVVEGAPQLAFEDEVENGQKG